VPILPLPSTTPNLPLPGVVLGVESTPSVVMGAESTPSVVMGAESTPSVVMGAESTPTDDRRLMARFLLASSSNRAAIDVMRSGSLAVIIMAIDDGGGVPDLVAADAGVGDGEGGEGGDSGNSGVAVST
jgi:hypothetical protein